MENNNDKNNQEKEIKEIENKIEENIQENKKIENNEENAKNESKITNEVKMYDNNTITIERQSNVEVEINTNENKKITYKNIINEDIKTNDKIYDKLKIFHNSSLEIKPEKQKEVRPSNHGHSKMRQIYEEIKAEALNKSKKKKEENINKENKDNNPQINTTFINLTEDGGIKKKILRNGKGDNPTEGKTVFINYIGKFKGKIFEQSKENEAFNFTIGENKVLKGWEIAVKSMKIGEKSEFFMTSEYTYGDKEINEWIPAKSILNYEIELVCIGDNDSNACLECMSYEEKMQWGKLLKSEGVSKFKANDISGAKECFLKTIPFLKTMDVNKEEEREGVELYLTILSNLCNCYNKEKEYTSVINFASIGLTIKPYAKLLYFRAIAYAYNEQFDNANEDYENLEKFFQENNKEENNNNNIEQTLKYVRYILDNRKQIYNDKNKQYSRAFYRQSLYFNKFIDFHTLIPPKGVNLENPIVFFEIKIGEKNVGKIEFELFKDITPITSENFRCLCLGNNDGMTYKGTYINKIIKDFVIGGGDLEKTSEKKCIYGEYFNDENYTYVHCRRGLLTMDNEGKNKNNSKFLITMKYIPWFDGKHVVFGQVINGMEIINQIEELETDDNDKPLVSVLIENCGEITDKENLKVENLIKEEKEKEEIEDVKNEKKKNEIKDNEDKDKIIENQENIKEQIEDAKKEQNKSEIKHDEDKDKIIENQENKKEIVEDMKEDQNKNEIKDNEDKDKIIENKENKKEENDDLKKEQENSKEEKDEQKNLDLEEPKNINKECKEQENKNEESIKIDKNKEIKKEENKEDNKKENEINNKDI